jgi:hypothetical protein
MRGLGDGEPIASNRFTVGGHEWVRAGLARVQRKRIRCARQVQVLSSAWTRWSQGGLPCPAVQVLLFYPDGKRSSSEGHLSNAAEPGPHPGGVPLPGAAAGPRDPRDRDPDEPLDAAGPRPGGQPVGLGVGQLADVRAAGGGGGALEAGGGAAALLAVAAAQQVVAAHANAAAAHANAAAAAAVPVVAAQQQPAWMHRQQRREATVGQGGPGSCRAAILLLHTLSCSRAPLRAPAPRTSTPRCSWRS